MILSWTRTKKKIYQDFLSFERTAPIRASVQQQAKRMKLDHRSSYSQRQEAPADNDDDVIPLPNFPLLPPPLEPAARPLSAAERLSVPSDDDIHEPSVQRRSASQQAQRRRPRVQVRLADVLQQ